MDSKPIKAIVLYWSATGNTRKVAETIQLRLEKEKVASRLVKIVEAGDEDLYAYDLVFMGAPAYQFHVPDPVSRFVKAKMQLHNERHDIKPGAPVIPGKWAVTFCTYSGPHTGIDEAIPGCKYLGQFFAHLGFKLMGEWYTVGEFQNREDLSTLGRLGDVRGRPDENDLAVISRAVSRLMKKIKSGTV
jgi:flavodoxin